MIWIFGANRANQQVSQRCTHASKMCILQKITEKQNKNTDARSSLRIVKASFGASVQLTSSPLLLISSQTGACVHICTGCHYCLLPLARLACTAGATPIQQVQSALCKCACMRVLSRGMSGPVRAAEGEGAKYLPSGDSNVTRAGQCSCWATCRLVRTGEALQRRNNSLGWVLQAFANDNQQFKVTFKYFKNFKNPTPNPTQIKI